MPGLPTAAPFPTSASVFPTPTPAQTDSTWGVNPWVVGSGYYTPPAQGTPAIVSPFSQQMLQAAGIQTQLDPTTGQPMAGDPASSIKAALAKLGTVNPVLAQQMLETYGANGAPTAGGGGLFHDLTHIAGEILAPGLSLGGKLMNLMGRTAHIVPSLAMDVVNGGSFKPLTDIASSLAGHDTTNWNAVFQQMGWKGGSFGWARALLGGIGDMATDPLTYAMAPLGGMAKSALGVEAGIKVATSAEAIERVAPALLAGLSKGGVEATAEDLPKLIAGAVRDYTGASGDKTIAQILKSGAPATEEGMLDRLGAGMGMVVDDQQRAALSQIMDLVSQGYTQTQGRTIQGLLRRGGTLTAAEVKDAAGTVIHAPLEVDMGALRKTLEAEVSKGNFTAYKGAGAELWEQSKVAAGLIGGIRPRFIVPFTGLRWMGPSVLGGALPMGIAARFLNGQAGLGTLVKGMASEAEVGGKAVSVTAEDLLKFTVGQDAAGNHVGSFRALQLAAEGGDTHSEQLVRLLKGHYGGLSSAYYSASETAGKLTAALIPGARLDRAGLAGYISHQNQRMARDAANNLTRNLMTNMASDEDGKKVIINVLRELKEATADTVRSGIHSDELAAHADGALYLDGLAGTTLRTDGASVANGSFRYDWENTDRYVAAKRLAAATGDYSSLDALDVQRREYEQLLSRLPDNSRFRNALDSLHQVWKNGKANAENMGANIGDSRRIGTAATMYLNPKDLEEWRGGGVDIGVRGTKFYMDRNDLSVPELLSTDAGNSEVHGIPGKHIFTTPGEGRVEVVLKVRNGLQYYEEGAAREELTTDTDVVKHIVDTVTNASKEGVRVHASIDPLFGDEGVAAAKEAADRQAAVWDGVDAVHPEMNIDHVVVHHADGSLSIVVRNNHDIAALDESAARYATERGYMPRFLTDGAKSYLGDAGKSSGTLATIHAEMERLTGSMTRTEAEAFLRQEGARFEGYTGKIFEDDLEKVHQLYTARLGKAVEAHVMGRVSDRLRMLSDLTPGQFGWAAQAMNTRPKFALDGVERLLRADARTQHAVLALAEATTKGMDKITASQSEQLVALGKLLEDVRNGVGPESDSEFGKAVQDIFRLQGEKAQAAADETAHLDQGVAYHQRQIENTAKVMQKLVGMDEHPPPEIDLEHQTIAEAIDAQLRYVLERDGTIAPGAEIDSTHKPLLGELGGPKGSVSEARTHAGMTPEGEGFKTTPSFEWHSWNSKEELQAYLDKERAADRAAWEAAHPGEDISHAPPWTVSHGTVAEPASPEEYIRQVVEHEANHAAAFKRMYDLGGEQQRSIPRLEGKPMFKGDVGAGEKGKAWKGFLDRLNTALKNDGWEGRPEARPYLSQYGRNGINAYHDATPLETIAELMSAWRGPHGDELPDSVKQFMEQEFPNAKRGMDAATARRLIEDGRVSVSSFEPGGKVFVDGEPGRFVVKSAEESRGHIADLLDRKEKLAAMMEDYDKFMAENDATGHRATAAEMLARAQSRVKTTIFDETGKSGAEVARLQERATRQAQRIGITLNNVQGELNRTIKQAREAADELKVALVDDAKAGIHAGFVKAEIPGLKADYYVHPYLAMEIQDFFNGKSSSDLTKMYRQHMLGAWKRWSTYRNPGFLVKHSFGRWFVNTIGGTTGYDYEIARRVALVSSQKEWATRVIEPELWKSLGFDNMSAFKGLEGKITYGDLGELAASSGIGRANTYAVAFANEAASEETGTTKLGWAGDRIHNVDTKLRNLSATQDDLHRTAAWLTGLRHTQGDLYGARAFAMMRQGDFGDMTHAERHIADLVPFYKWMRTNIPFQVRMLAENPAALVTIQKAQRTAFEMMGYDYEKYQKSLPSWLQPNLSIPIPGQKQDATGGVAHLSFMLPYADLHKGLRDYISSMLPLGRNIIESYGIKQSIFTGAPLGSKMVPLGAPFNLPGLRNVLEATGMVHKGADGQPYIPDTLDNVLQAVPLYSRFKDWVTGDPTRVEARSSAFLSWATAFQYQSQGQAIHNLTAKEQAFYFDEMVPLLANLRSMGYKFPTAAALKTTANALVNNHQPLQVSANPNGYAW